MPKLELKDRRKIYLILVLAAPLVIGAGWLSKGWVEFILIASGIILETGGLGMAAHFSRELPPPESSSEDASGLNPAEQLIKPLLPLGEDGLDLGLDRPHRSGNQVKLLKGLLPLSGGPGLLPLLENFEPVLGPLQDLDHVPQLLGGGGPFLRDRDQIHGVTLHRCPASPRPPP